MQIRILLKRLKDNNIFEINFLYILIISKIYGPAVEKKNDLEFKIFKIIEENKIKDNNFKIV